MARVAIIGGGIAGLSVALARARALDEVVLFEASAELGGQLRTQRENGFIVEQGAEGFVASSEAMAALAAELGIGARVVGQLCTSSYAFDGRELHELRRGEAGELLGFQVPRRDLGQGIRAFVGGMADVVEALAAALGPIADLRVSSPVKGLKRRAASWELEVGGAPIGVNAVIVATPAAVAASLLAPEFGENAAALAGSATLSSVTVSLAYRREAIPHALAATGFIVAENAQEEGFRACTFTSSKLPERAPPGRALLRAFFRPTAEDLRELSDAAWVERATRGIALALAPAEAPLESWVARWPDALPVFDAIHGARVVALESVLAGSGVVLAGAAFHGAGIDGALRSARRAVTESP